MDSDSDGLLTPKHKFYFDTAAQLAELSTFKQFPMGCVVVYKNKIISTGVNKNRTDPLQKKYNRYREVPDDGIHKSHCEVNALKHIMHLNINWKQVSIYIVRLRKISKYGLAAPCPSCMRLIKDLGIRHLYYSTDNGFCYEELI